MHKKKKKHIKICIHIHIHININTCICMYLLYPVIVLSRNEVNHGIAQLLGILMVKTMINRGIWGYSN